MENEFVLACFQEDPPTPAAAASKGTQECCAASPILTVLSLQKQVHSLAKFPTGK